MNLTEELWKLQDLKYRDFHSRLVPNIPKERMIGVRTPALRALGKKAALLREGQVFLTDTPHFYYDENNLHGALIEYGRYSFETTLTLIGDFLPLIDNWATCDMFIPSVFKKNPAQMLQIIPLWLQSDHPYTVRFGVNCLMRDFLDGQFSPAHFTWLNQIQNPDYYVKMGIAWYYSIALIKQWDEAFPAIRRGLPDPWIQNKSIQKARESYRLTNDQKDLLLQYKIPIHKEKVK